MDASAVILAQGDASSTILILAFENTRKR